MDSAHPPDLSDSPVDGSPSLKDKGIDDDTDLVSKKVTQSWATTAKDRKCLKKYDVEVTMKEGKHMVEIPDEVIDDSTPLWEDFVVGKFLDLAPHVAKVHMVLNKIWRYGDESTKVEVYEINPNTMRFKVSNPKAREKILRRGMWNILGVPMIVTKWSPKGEEDKQEEENIPMWVHVRNVPLHMYSWQGLSLITSPVGFPVRLHPETVACTNLNEAKVFVKVDVSKVLPKEINFTKNGTEFTAEFHYPWLPSRCNFCNKWGLVEKVCGMRSKERKQRERRAEEMNGGETPEKVLSIVKNREEENDKGTILKITAQEQSLKANRWSIVSPSKSGKSAVIPLQGTEVIPISASKFAVLSDELEEGEVVRNEKQEVEDIEEEDEHYEVNEVDMLEDSILAQRSIGKDRAVQQKGAKRGESLEFVMQIRLQV